jgi:hypothetical protein
MPSRLRRHAAPLLATVIVLVVGLAGAAAAGVGPVGKQIQQYLDQHPLNSGEVKNHSLKGKDVKTGTLTGKQVKDHSLGGAELKSGSVPGTVLKPGTVQAKQIDPRVLKNLKGAPGAKGAQGIQGAPGQTGPAGPVDVHTQVIEPSPPLGDDPEAGYDSAVLLLPAGTWSVTARIAVIGSNVSGGDTFICELRDSAGVARDRAVETTQSSSSAPPLVLVGVVTATATARPTIHCSVPANESNGESGDGIAVSQRVTTVTRDPINPTSTPTPGP